MKKISSLPRSIALLTVLLFCIASQNIFSQESKPFSLNESPLPAPTAPVNDYVGVLSESGKQQLNKKITDFKAKTNPAVELAVAIVKTTGERPIFDFSLAVARGWGIGSKEDDSPGALLFIAIDDRKYFTQISRNLEDELPDGLAGQLNRQYLVPAFKQVDYEKGVSDTIDAYIKAIEAKQSGQAVPTPETIGKTAQKSRGGISLCGVLPCLIILFIIMILIFSRAGKSRRDKNDDDRWGGGGFGGGGGDVLSHLAAGAAGAVIGNILGGGSSSSSSSDWGGSSGGSDWGGFGGGGDFGGGGAGGDW